MGDDPKPSLAAIASRYHNTALYSPEHHRLEFNGGRPTEATVRYKDGAPEATLTLALPQQRTTTLDLEQMLNGFAWALELEVSRMTRTLDMWDNPLYPVLHIPVGSQWELDRVVEGASRLAFPLLQTLRYFAGRAVGKGSWGIVFKGIDTINGDHIAIKQLRPRKDRLDLMTRQGKDELGMIVSEAGMSAACAHVVPRHVEVDGTKPFLCMPYYAQFFDEIVRDDGDRRSLRDGLSLPQIVQYAIDIASGLREVHIKLGRAYRDLKPTNIAIDAQGRLLLADLGIATILEDEKPGEPDTNRGARQTRAPECYLNQKLDAEGFINADMWSFGAMLYRLIDGKYPLEDDLAAWGADIFKDTDALDRLMRKRISHLPGIGKTVRKILYTTLNVDAKKRFGPNTIIPMMEHYYPHAIDSTNKKKLQLYDDKFDG